MQNNKLSKLNKLNKLNKLSRRHFLKKTAQVFAHVALLSAVLPRQILKAAEKILFKNTFFIPPLLEGIKKGSNVYFDLNIQSGTSSILEGKKTKTWGINQNFLGVTLKANKGDRVHIKVKNTLEKTTTLHWHGMKLPAIADGGPHQPIYPLKTWKTEFDIIQPAATLWYHAHTHKQTGQQVYNGLAGMFLIDDEKSKSLNLPCTYGIDDFPVMILDRSFTPDGSLEYIRSRHDQMMGKRGSHVLINGVHKPVLTVSKSLIRLRLLNASNARVYRIQFKDTRLFNIIGSDGGLLEEPVLTNSVLLAPAERAEIIVEIAKEDKAVLVYRYQGRDSVKTLDLLHIKTKNFSKSTANLPKKLVTHKKENIKNVDEKRFMQLQMQRPKFAGDSMFKINNVAMDMNKINEVVKAESLELWTVENQAGMAHPFHIHNVQFKIISRNTTKTLYGHELGFKDVVLLGSREKVQLLMRFPKYSDSKTPYMYHCHILEHEDEGMMGQFTVV